MDRYLNEFIHNKYPRNRRDLAVDGNDILALGYKNAEVGEVLKSVLISILSDLVKNEHKDIMDFIFQSRLRKLGNG